jgi:alpha-L-fucosidase
MNNSWGYNITDVSYKSAKDLIHYMVNAAGHNANFLLNVGPMPNGEIQAEFKDTLKAMGKLDKAKRRKYLWNKREYHSTTGVGRDHIER